MPRRVRKPLTPLQLRDKKIARKMTREAIGPTALLAGLTANLATAHVAFIGPADPVMMRKVSCAAVKRLGRGWRPEVKPVTCFCWDGAYYKADAHLQAFRLAPHADRDIAEVVRFAVSNTGRLGWTAAVDQDIVEGRPPFGLVVHLGASAVADMRGDFACLLPMMDDATIVVLMNLRLDAPEREFWSMIRKGWHGVRVGPTFDIGVLQMPAIAKETT